MSIHPDTRIGAVHFFVGNLSQSTEFYQQAVGLHIHFQDENTAHLGPAQGEDLVVLEWDESARRYNGTTGLYHIAIRVPSREELSRSLWRIAESGWQLEGVADHGVSEALYLSDREGNGIEIYRDRPREEWPMRKGKLAMVNAPLDLDALLREANRESALNGVNPETTMGHIHLRVANIEQSENFYCNVLGFDFVQRYGDSASFVSAGGYHHHIGMNTWQSLNAQPSPENAMGLKFFTILLQDMASLEPVVKRVRTAGITMDEHETGWFVRDPAGNRILLSSTKTQA